MKMWNVPSINLSQIPGHWDRFIWRLLAGFGERVAPAELEKASDPVLG